MSVAEEHKSAEVSAEEIDQLAEKLYWPPEDASEEALHLVREVIRGATLRMRHAIAELRELVEVLPKPEQTAVPRDLDRLMPGAFIETFGVELPSGVHDSHTHPIWYMVDAVIDIVDHIECEVNDLERSTEKAERETVEGIRTLLAAIPPDLFRAIAKRIEEVEPAEFVMPDLGQDDEA